VADIPVGLCGPSSVTQSPYFDNAEAINCFCEKAENPGARSQIAMWGTPGKKLFASLTGEVSVPSVYTVNGRSFAAGANFWELTQAGPINRGSLGFPPLSPSQITGNQTQLAILNNGNLYVFTLATNVLTPVDMSQFNGPILQIGFADGYILAALQNSNTFQQSNLEDATTWQGLNISTISLFPDNITSMICDHREVWFFSAKKTAVYYNAGAGFPVFIPIQGAFLEVGAGAAFATVQMDNSVFWLSQDERGSMVAFRANGYAGERKSTHAEELAWQMYGTPYGADAVGYSYQENGHTFWVISFPSANTTWAYDVASGYWHKRASWDQTRGAYNRDRSCCHTFNFGMHLVGDPLSGNVYQMSSELYTDNGNIIRGYRRTSTQSDNNKWIYFDSFELDMEVGLPPSSPLTGGDGQARPPQIMLRWSDNAGKTWSNEYILSVGDVGTYKRVIKRRLGRARKRVWEVSWTDPIAWRFIACYTEGTTAVN
jgi:hypothetical protein